MENAPIRFTFAGLPEGYCFTTPDRFALDITSLMSGYVPGQYNFLIDSETEPGISDRSKLWHKRLPGGIPTGKLFGYFMGKWVTPHEISPPSIARVWVEASPAEIWAYDGGDGADPNTTPPTDSTGAMWEEDTNYAARFALGAGTSPAPYTTPFNVGDTGGDEKIILSANQLAKHRHGIACSEHGKYGDTLANPSYPTDRSVPTTTTQETEELGNDEAHNNTPLYRVGRWIKRTGRIYRTA